MLRQDHIIGRKRLKKSKLKSLCIQTHKLLVRKTELGTDATKAQPLSTEFSDLEDELILLSLGQPVTPFGFFRFFNKHSFSL